jgi:crossover junction endodeoxyribonuclease RuvC
VPKVLGIDPGLTRCGVGVVDVDSSRRARLVQVDVYKTGATEELPVRIGKIGHSIRELIEAERPELIALERVFAQVNLKTVMGTAQISGVVLALAYEFRIPIVMFTPTQVKAAVTGSGRADKLQVANMVVRLLKLKEAPKPVDATDALAIALTAALTGVDKASTASSSSLSPAKAKWIEAERATAKSRKR